MEQSNGSAQFLQVASSFDGRAWFVVQRQYAAAQAAIVLTITGAPTTIATATRESGYCQLNGRYIHDHRFVADEYSSDSIIDELLGNWY